MADDKFYRSIRTPEGQDRRLNVCETTTFHPYKFIMFPTRTLSSGRRMCSISRCCLLTDEWRTSHASVDRQVTLAEALDGIPSLSIRSCSFSGSAARKPTPAEWQLGTDMDRQQVSSSRLATSNGKHCRWRIPFGDGFSLSPATAVLVTLLELSRCMAQRKRAQRFHAVAVEPHHCSLTAALESTSSCN